MKYSLILLMLTACNYQTLNSKNNIEFNRDWEQRLEIEKGLER